MLKYFILIFVFSNPILSNELNIEFNLRKSKTKTTLVKNFLYKNTNILDFGDNKYIASNIKNQLFKFENTRFWHDPFYSKNKFEKWHPFTDKAVDSFLPEFVNFLLSNTIKIDNENYLKFYGYQQAENKKDCAKQYTQNLLANYYFYDAEVFNFDENTGIFRARIHRDIREGDALTEGTSNVGAIALDYHNVISVVVDEKNKKTTQTKVYCTYSCYADFLDELKKEKFNKISKLVNFVSDASKTCMELYTENTHALRLRTRVHSIEDARNSDGLTRLHIAAKQCNEEKIIEALNNNAPINLKDYNGKTALDYAIENNCIIEILNLLKP